MPLITENATVVWFMFHELQKRTWAIRSKMFSSLLTTSSLNVCYSSLKTLLRNGFHLKLFSTAPIGVCTNLPVAVLPSSRRFACTYITRMFGYNGLVWPDWLPSGDTPHLSKSSSKTARQIGISHHSWKNKTTKFSRDAKTLGSPSRSETYINSSI